MLQASPRATAQSYSLSETSLMTTTLPPPQHINQDIKRIKQNITATRQHVPTSSCDNTSQTANSQDNGTWQTTIHRFTIWLAVNNSLINIQFTDVFAVTFSLEGSIASESWHHLSVSSSIKCWRKTVWKLLLITEVKLYFNVRYWPDAWRYHTMDKMQI